MYIFSVRIPQFLKMGEKFIDVINCVGVAFCRGFSEVELGRECDFEHTQTAIHMSKVSEISFCTCKNCRRGIFFE